MDTDDVITLRSYDFEKIKPFFSEGYDHQL